MTNKQTGMQPQQISIDVLAEKYFKGDETTVEQLYRRVANALAAVEKKSIRKATATMFYDNMMNGAIGAGRIMSAAGADIQATLINCFVQPVGDCIKGFDDNGLPGIYEALREAAETMRRGGGVGYDFSAIRPNGAYVKGTGSSASGPCSYMDVFDKSCTTVESAGARRGAQMGVLRIDHPDVMDFITAKRTPGRWNNFNVSVGVSEAFMKAVEADAKWDLVHQCEPSKAFKQKNNCAQLKSNGWWVYKTVRARELWDTIMKSTYDFAEPGILFMDNINKDNNLWYCEKISATNPCWTGDTLVSTLKGPRSFKYLAKRGKDVDVYCMDPKTGRTMVRTMRNPRLTRKQVPVLEIVVDKLTTHRNGYPYQCDRFESFKLTSDHNLFVYAKDGSIKKKKAKHLEEGDRLVAHQIRLQGRSGRETMVLDRGVFRPQHCLMAEKMLNRELLETEEVHHKDGDHFNNKYKNLEVYDEVDHKSIHMREENLRRAQNKDEYYNGVANPNANPMTVEELIDEGVLLLKKHGHLSRSLWLEQDGLPRKSAMEKRFGGFHNFRNLVIERMKEEKQPNHTVVAVRKAGVEDVYNGTVDDVHTYFVCDKSAKDGSIVTGFLSANCGEQPLPPYGCCDLGPINLTKFVRNPFGPYVKRASTNSAYFDFDAFKKAVTIQVRALDNVLDATFWPLKQQYEESRDKRRIGVGYTGLGNTLAMLCLKYSSQEGRDMAVQITKTMRDAAYRASVQLAIEKEPFPLLDVKKYLDNDGDSFASRLPKDIRDLIRKHGIRNSHLLSIAPTGTVSLAFCDNASNGIEPPFSWTYTRKKRENDGSWSEYQVEDHAYRLYRELGGDVTNLPEFFQSALEMSAQDHLQMMIEVQPYIDTAISKTVNIPVDYPFESFKNLYFDAWKGNIKGLATYRPNATLGSVLSVEPSKKEEPKEEQRTSVIDPMKVVIEKRPKGSLNAVSEKIEYWTHEGKKRMYLLVSFLPVQGPNGPVERAVEFFMPIGQSGESQQWMTSSMRLLSLAARGGFLDRALKDMRKVIWDRGPVRLGTHTKEDGTTVPMWHDSEVAAMAYAIQQILQNRGKKDTPDSLEAVEPAVNPDNTVPAMTGKKCPECGAHSLIKMDGCEKCTSCGYMGSCG